MSRKEKLLRRFLTRPVDFRFEEMSVLLGDLGYERVLPGKTGGSRVAFIDRQSGHIIRLHRPHAGKTMKAYQLELVEEALRAKGIIK